MKARMIAIEAEGDAAVDAAAQVADFIRRGQAAQTAVNEILASKGSDPIDVIASVIQGPQETGRATRKKAQAVLDALRAAGWRVLRG